MINFQALNVVYKKFPKHTTPFLTKQLDLLLETKRKPFAGLKIVHNIHLTLSTICKLVPLIIAGAELTVTLSKHLQAAPGIFDILDKINIKFIPWNELPNDFDISLDCGAGLASIVKPKIGAVELTQSGKAIFERAGFSYPVISVDDSNLKKLETLFGTGDGFKRAIISLVKEDLSDKQFVVFGYGKVGHGIVRTIRQLTSKPIVIVEIDDTKLQKAQNDGHIAIHGYNKEKVIDQVNNAFCAVTATGDEGCISRLFTKDDFKCKYLANMGTDDEFGSNFSNDSVLCNKMPINFSLEEPTLIKYLDPVFYAHNESINLLLAEKKSPGFYRLPLDFDMEIVNSWAKIHKEDVSEILI